jgi:glyoxylase-like metal-dependent hydrolase (beta-lactamase superfamily II)
LTKVGGRARRPRKLSLASLRPIDLHFGGAERAIGVYLLDTPDGPALFDCGPTSTLPRLKEGLRERGLELRDLRHLLLSHVHLDHAGAAGAIVREHPELTVWVSEIGAPHVVDPSRLERSARRLYGELFDQLWGELAPVPERNIRIAAGDVLGLESFPSPGHANHHVCYFDNSDGTLLAGDAAGVRVQPARYVLPVSPPPDVDVEAWHRTIAEIERRRPDRLALIHFGVETDVGDHLRRLGDELDRWAGRVRDGMSVDDFVEAARADAGEDADVYDRVAPFWQSWHGLRRYWDKRAEAA